MNVKVHHGATYSFFTIYNNYSCFNYAYLISYDFKALDYFKRFVVEIENNKKKMNIFQTNRGHKYLSH